MANGEYQLLYLASNKKFDALLAEHGNKPIAMTGKLIGVHFQFAHESNSNAQDDKIVAVAIGHDLPASCAVVLQIDSLDKLKVMSALRTLLEDTNITKIMYDVERVAKSLHSFGLAGVDLSSCMDLQILYQLLVDSKVSKENLKNIVLAFGGKSTISIQQQVAEFNANLKPNAWKKSPLAPPMQKMLVQSMRLYTRCYSGACGLSGVNSKFPSVYAATKEKWKNSLFARSSTSIIAGVPVANEATKSHLGKTTSLILKPTRSTPHVAAIEQTVSPSPFIKIEYVSSNVDLQRLLQKNNKLMVGAPSVVGIHFQFTQDNTNSSEKIDHDQLALISIVSKTNAHDTAVVLQLDSLDLRRVLSALQMLLNDPTIVKVMHSLHRAAFCLHRNGLSVNLKGCIDLQIAYENNVDSSELRASMHQIVNFCKSRDNKSNLAHTMQSFKASVRPLDSSTWANRPLPESLLRMVASSAQLYAQCYDELDLASNFALYSWMTTARWRFAIENQGLPAIWFNPDSENQPRSLEYFTFHNGRTFFSRSVRLPSIILPLKLQCEINSLIRLLPQHYQDAIVAIEGYNEKLVDICLDVGRIPFVYIGKKQRVVLSKNGVTKDIIDEIVNKLGGETRIGGDNRAGIDRQLHRISVMRSKKDEIYGLTMRVGRALCNAACVLTDLLLSTKHANKSVLVLGHPGSGKTTLIRDVARCVSETMENVCIIDTSNEIGGDGLVPHECIGWARRMMVPSLEAQARVMVECVQNHTVETLIVDEIGRKAEVLAASTVRQRGPRLIASAHGDFRALIKNPDLKGLVGGSQQVIVGDKEAKTSSQGKLQSQRAGNPIFDVIVELDHVCRGRCQIIWDVAKAVDNMLEGNDYAVEIRRWEKSTVGVQVLGDIAT